MKTCLRLLCFSLLLVCQASFAAADWYQVEVIVFENTQDSLPQAALKHAARPETENAISLLPPQDKNYYLPFELMPKSAQKLASEEARLMRSEQFKVLFHAAWLQDLASEQTEKTIHIQGADIANQNDLVLDGTLSLIRRKYVEVDANLLLKAKDESDDNPIQLVQHRKLRSNELHYLDSPRLGVLIKVTPYS